MGGKRPDQYRLDPGETQATDYKNRVGEHGIPEQETQKYATQPDPDAEPIPHSADNPALADLKAKRAARAEQAEETGDAAARRRER